MSNDHDCKVVDPYNARKRHAVIESLDLMRIIPWLLSFEGIVRLFTNFYLHSMFSIFVRNDRDCKAVEALNIFEKLS